MSEGEVEMSDAGSPAAPRRSGRSTQKAEAPKGKAKAKQQGDDEDPEDESDSGEESPDDGSDAEEVVPKKRKAPAGKKAPAAAKKQRAEEEEEEAGATRPGMRRLAYWDRGMKLTFRFSALRTANARAAPAGRRVGSVYLQCNF
jgi:hypothetical protein